MHKALMVKPRCCMAQGCFSCDKTAEYIQSTPLLTPYYRTLGEDSCPQPLPMPNYLPYDLFCLRTKMQHYLYKIDPTYDFTFVSKALDGVMRVTMEIYKGGKFVALEEGTADRIQRYIDKSVSLYTDYCLLLDARIPIRRGTKTLTRAWVSSLLPFFTLEAWVKPIVNGGRIFIHLRKDPQYKDRYAQLNERVTEILLDYFERGILPLSSRFHSTLIEQWKLEIVNQLPSEMSVPGELSLYEPMWRNQHFAPQPIAFLYQRIEGEKNLRLYVGDNFVRRHFVAIALIAWLKKKRKRSAFTIPSEDYVPTFSREYVLVPVENVADAITVSNVVLSAQAKSTGHVEVVPFEDPDLYARMELGILNQYQTLQSGEDMVLYRVVDTPPYLASVLIPAGIDDMTILSNKG